MQRRKIIIATLVVMILFAGFFGTLIKCSNKRILDWKIVDIHKRNQCWINEQMELNCLEVEICLTNPTSSEACIDWNRDESEFKVNGAWVKNQEIAGRAYIGPYDSITFPVFVPQKTQALHYRMHYEDSPLWSTTDEFLRGHNFYLSESMFETLMKYDRKIPAHWKQLDIEVELMDLKNTNLSGGKL